MSLKTKKTEASPRSCYTGQIQNSGDSKLRQHATCTGWQLGELSRTKGIGPRIISWVEDYVRRNGCSHLKLDCDAMNPFIIAYYEARGFRRIKIVNVMRNERKQRPYLLMEKCVNIAKSDERKL
jgi:hypothetical protein